MSVAGVGNVTVGALVADGLKYLATPLQNKPSTKGDIASKMKRIHKVTNLPLNEKEATPYFYLEKKKIIYSIWLLYG